MNKKYDTDPASTHFGMRLTSCCAAHSTYSMDTGELYCKACFGAVGEGEGDGTELLQDNTTDPNTCCVCKTAEGDVDELLVEGWVTFCNPCLDEIERLQENTDELNK